MLGQGISQVGAPLCDREYKQLFDLRWDAPWLKAPEFYNQGFHEGVVEAPKHYRVHGSIAVFNYGLHLLGGVVDPTRWVLPGHGSAEKGAFVASLNTSYPNVTRAFVAELRHRGFKHVVFKYTNTIRSGVFVGGWKKAVDACSLASVRRSTKSCNQFMRRCVQVNGDTLRDACQHLCFDPEGSFNINEVAAVSLLGNHTASVFIPRVMYQQQPFFANAYGSRLVDGVLDAQVSEDRHHWLNMPTEVPNEMFCMYHHAYIQNTGRVCLSVLLRSLRSGTRSAPRTGGTTFSSNLLTCGLLPTQPCFGRVLLP